MNTHPSRIVCLNAETTETLCLLGEGRRIVGYSGHAARLPSTEHGKPRVSINGVRSVECIVALEPDLVLGFGDSHAPVLGLLAQRGIAVHLFNHRSVRGTLGMIRTVGGLVGRELRAADLASSIEWRIEAIRARANEDRRPRIYLEEWDEPSITASAWVSELIDIAGGINCFADVAHHPQRERRIVEDLDEVVRRTPDIVIGAWVGRTFHAGRVAQRDGWRHVPAVANGELHGIASVKLLHPGPASLTEGLAELHRIVENWRERRTRVFRTVFVPSRSPHKERAEERVA